MLRPPAAVDTMTRAHLLRESTMHVQPTGSSEA